MTGDELDPKTRARFERDQVEDCDCDPWHFTKLGQDEWTCPACGTFWFYGVTVQGAGWYRTKRVDQP